MAKRKTKLSAYHTPKAATPLLMGLNQDQHRGIAEAFEEAATHPVLTPELRVNYLYKARLARLSAKTAGEQELEGTPTERAYLPG